MRAIVSHEIAPISANSATIERVPVTDITTMTNTTVGNPYSASTIRIISSSIRPPA